MVVEMVAAEIGEASDMDVQTVEAVLRQTVAACLERQMRHPGGCQRLQRGVKADGVGRCQGRQAKHASLHLARVGPLKPERADGGRVPGCARPDLAQEFRCRGLAVGAGDGGNHARLTAPEPGGGKGQFAARLGAGQHRHARCRDCLEPFVKLAFICQYGHRARLHSGGGMRAPVAGASFQRDKKMAFFGLAGIAAEAADVDAADGGVTCVGSDRSGNQVRKMQGSSPLYRS